ncbi:MAG: hypothetical protein CBR30_00300 [Dictyoglomus sp. NZ13-RE01]|nr:MAG: hypothetical protein CBR30_00300 [Dictyoglomus sp. NZ13-RE01]
MRSICKEKIREDENFETYKIYFPSEDLVNELKERGIEAVYKGDQNILWDALITDLALKIRLEDKVKYIPFIHDEKLGTGDQRLANLYDDKNRFTITEDYAQKVTGAVYINQDISYGIFYAVPIEPHEYKNLGFHLSWISRKWRDYKKLLINDDSFTRAIESLGFTYNYHRVSQVTRLGPCANISALKKLFERNPQAEIYYLFSKSLGWYGIVPREAEDISLSSIYLDESNIKILLEKLFILGVRGTLKQIKNKNYRKRVIERAKKIRNWYKEIIFSNHNISIVDLHKYISKKIIEDLYKNDIELKFETTSNMFRITSKEEVKEDSYYFFDLSLRNPQLFAQAYNMALNKAGLHLKRMHIKNNTFSPPFFMEVFSIEKSRLILTRCNIEIKNDGISEVRLYSPHCTSTTLISKNSLSSACEFIKTLLDSERFPHGFSLIGKAGPFMAEMRKYPKILAVPELGSKYAPMVDYFLGELFRRGVEVPSSHLLRIRINLLDNLKYLGDTEIILPKYLSIFFGETVDPKDFSYSWRNIVDTIDKFLEIISNTQQGEYFHLAKIILAEKGIIDFERSHKYLKYKEKIKNSIGIIKEIKIPMEFLEELKNLIYEREKILNLLRERKKNSDKSLFDKRDLLEYKILFLFGVLIRGLLLVKESLIYINYRPYSLILYLLGDDFFKTLVNNAQFNLEEIKFKT